VVDKVRGVAVARGGMADLCAVLADEEVVKHRLLHNRVAADCGFFETTCLSALCPRRRIRRWSTFLWSSVRGWTSRGRTRAILTATIGL